MQLAGEVLEEGVRCHQPDAFTWYAGQLFTLRWLQGRLPELMPDIEAQVADVATAIPSWYAAYGLALATAGRREEAQVILDHFVATELGDLPRDILWLHGMSYLCQLSAHLDDATAAGLLHRALLPYAGLVAHNGTSTRGRSACTWPRSRARWASRGSRPATGRTRRRRSVSWAHRCGCATSTTCSCIPDRDSRPGTRGLTPPGTVDSASHRRRACPRRRPRCEAGPPGRDARGPAPGRAGGGWPR